MRNTSSGDNDQTGEELIGLISDSHGHVEDLVAVLAFLKKHDCQTIYHLGDICDSLHPETADACVALLREYRVKGVRGNNDHNLIVNQTGYGASVKSETMRYLEQLPLSITIDTALLTHSLPFEKELGMSCMIGAMNRQHALHFFRRFPDCILFRGHSHSPDITWQDHGGNVHSEKVESGQTLILTDRIPCIVTCGALDEGYCMIWSPVDNTVSCKNAKTSPSNPY